MVAEHSIFANLFRKKELELGKQGYNEWRTDRAKPSSTGYHMANLSQVLPCGPINHSNGVSVCIFVLLRLFQTWVSKFKFWNVLNRAKFASYKSSRFSLVYKRLGNIHSRNIPLFRKVNSQITLKIDSNLWRLLPHPPRYQSFGIGKY